jgi:hypothetical protein
LLIRRVPNPLHGVCLLFDDNGRSSAFLGTCFAFRYKNHFLTAAHCVKDRALADLAVYHPFDGVYSRVARVVTHASADIAVVVLVNEGREGTQPFLEFTSSYGAATQYTAYGFPEDSMGPNQGKPIARVFRGYFQRFMEYESGMGYKYVAGELSIACPGGLSGGPLFILDQPWVVFGLVAENLETTTFLDSVEQVLDDGQLVHEHYRRVINYGVAVMLDQIGEWIDQHVPRAT